MNEKEFLTIGEASEYSKVSRVTLWRMIKEGRLTAYADPRDRRVKLVKREELEAAMRPVPLTIEQIRQEREGKDAA